MSLARLSILCAVAATLLAAPAEAKRLRVAGADLSANIPSNWTTATVDRGLEAKSPDEEVFFWIETYAVADLASVVSEHETYFKEQGVKLKGEPIKNIQKESGATIAVTQFTGTHQGKPTIIRYVSIEWMDPSKARILMTVWASPKGDRAYGGEITEIIKSLE